MPAPRRRALAMMLVGGAVSGSLIALAAPGGAGSAASGPKVLQHAPALAAVRELRVKSPLEGFDPLSQRLQGSTLVSDLPDGRRAELTLEPGLQARMRAMLRDYAVPYGAVVALEPASGRVLAYVSQSTANPNAGDLARDATPPSASVFKLVTAAALIEAGVPPDESVCYGGGLRRLALADVLDNPARDRACATLAQAISGSINAVVAKLADRRLDRATIERFAHAFGFGQALPFDSPTQPSLLDVPEDRLERARTAAGFWHSYMSPLHGAVLAATIANRGEMPRPAMVERVSDAEGHDLYVRQPSPAQSVISSATAATLGQMMLGTVSHGTARTAFRDAHGRSYLPGIAVAGKTGSLSSDKPFRAYSWWVGYAPEAAPEIALAALVVNTPEWRIKASQVAREALRYYLIERKSRAAKVAIQAPVAPSPR